MATHTRLDDGAIAELATSFAVGEVVAWQPIAAGTINSNFAVSTSSGRYFLRINEGKRVADIAYEADLVTALARAGVPTPVPLVAADGQRFVGYRDRYASMFPWIEGGHRGLTEVDTGDTAQVGAAVAELHLAGAGLPITFHRAESLYTFAEIVERFAGFRQLDDPALTAAVPLIADEIDWLNDRARDRAAATRGIIHGDLFRDNVIFAGAELVALIDFEQASAGSLAYDLAVCICAWCYTDHFVPELIAAMVEGYCGRRPLLEADRDLLFIEARCAALRFAVTRITDIHLAAIDKPDKDFRRYLERLTELRQVGAAGFASWTRAG